MSAGLAVELVSDRVFETDQLHFNASLGQRCLRVQELREKLLMAASHSTVFPRDASTQGRGCYVPRRDPVFPQCSVGFVLPRIEIEGE